MEVRRLIARWPPIFPPEQVGILFTRKSETVHEHLKIICDVPTSTRLGAKGVHGFRGPHGRTLTEIEGEIARRQRHAHARGRCRESPKPADPYAQVLSAADGESDTPAARMPGRRFRWYSVLERVLGREGYVSKRRMTARGSSGAGGATTTTTGAVMALSA